MPQHRKATPRRMRIQHTLELFVLLHILGVVVVVKSLSLPSGLSRREVLSGTLSLLFTSSVTNESDGAVVVSSSSSSSMREIIPFQTTALGKEEYTNSITASRDTNLSPREAYDVILQQTTRRSRSSTVSDGHDQDKRFKALDLGAGAGLSTSLLYNVAGYQEVDAVDWSGDAWRSHVTQQPDTVRFFEMSDEQFFAKIKQQGNDDTHNNKQQQYDCIVYNFAVNYEKAKWVARTYLHPENGILLAPVNDRADYWYKQTYLLLDASGNIVWKSGQEVGAWSVQFQPDVTSPTCTGIWCGGFNGFLKR